jgi:hypothetical protein
MLWAYIYIFEQYQHICFKSELDGSSISHKMKYSGILEGSNRWWSLVIVYNTEYGSYNHHLCNLSRATKLRWYNKSERVYIHIHIYIYIYILCIYIHGILKAAEEMFFAKHNLTIKTPGNTMHKLSEPHKTWTNCLGSGQSTEILYFGPKISYKYHTRTKHFK